MSDIAIQVDNLSKQYRIGRSEDGRSTYGSLRETLADAARAPIRRLRRSSNGDSKSETDFIWALKDVSFEVKKGEVVGIIGRNGAGKTTLLKVLSRITRPTKGNVRLWGRVGSLLEVGTGFHPELTGRENIYLNGAVLGMGRVEIERKFDEIVDFAEIEQFLDTPVKRYSSGMYMRLAFAVAAHLEPEILLVDEVLAVGDAAFQKKCLGKMGEVAKEGRTVLFVSHNMPAIISLCGISYFLEKGSLAYNGASEDVVGRYLQSMVTKGEIPLAERMDRLGNGKVRLVSLTIASTSGLEVVRSSDGLLVRIVYTSATHLRKPAFLIGIFDNLSRRVFFLDSRDAGGLPEALPAIGSVVCTTESINLPPGNCSLNIAILVEGEVADHIVGAHFFEVNPDDFFGTGRLVNSELAISLLRQEWKFEK